MDKKLILEEISRISEIMNIKNKINLFESLGLGNEIVKYVEKDITKSVDDVINILEKSAISNPNLVANAFRDLISKDTISKAEREFAANVFRTIFPSIISKSVYDFINAPQRNPLARKKFIKFFLNDEKTLSEKAEKLKKLGYGNATKLTAKIWEDELKKIKPNIVPPKPPKPEPTPKPIIDFDIPNISDETWNLGKKNGVGTSFYNNLGTTIGGMEPNRAEKLRQEMAEDMHNLNVKDKEENIRAKKEFNELDALDKEIKIRIRKLELEEKQLSIKEKEGKITSNEKLRQIEIKQEKIKLSSSRVDLLKKMGFIFITLAVIVGAIVVYNKFCSSWFTGLCNFIKGDSDDEEEDDQL